MEWLKAILDKAEIKEGKLNVDALMSTINAEAPKNVIPKSEYNNVNKQLKTANETIEGLKKNNSDNETLQKTIKDHEETIKNLEKKHTDDLVNLKKDSAINQALIKAKAKYPDVAAKLIDKEKVLINEDGTISGLEEQIKANKENYKDMFETENVDTAYVYSPQSGSSGVSTGATSFVDIINENQAKR